MPLFFALLSTAAFTCAGLADSGILDPRLFGAGMILGFCLGVIAIVRGIWKHV